MYCTQWLLHKLPILITFTLNIYDLCAGADCIIFFCCRWVFLPHRRCRDQNISPKHFNCVHYARRPRRKLVMKAELPRTPASQACLRSARLFGAQRRASVVRGRQPLEHLGCFAPLWLRHFRHNAWKSTGRKSVLSSIFCRLPLLLHSGSPGRCRISPPQSFFFLSVFLLQS